jgi:hypothetical protein
MAITIAKQDSFHNSTGASELYLDLSDVEAGRLLWVWISYIVWNISGSVTRVFYQDGATEIDLVQVEDSGNFINPRIFLWRLAAVPARVDPGARVVVQFSPTGDRRISAIGYSLRGVDPVAPIPAATFNNDQTTTAKTTFLNFPIGGGSDPTMILDFVTCLRGGSLPKPDYIPLTPGLIEVIDMPAFPGGSAFFGSASGKLAQATPAGVFIEWQVSFDFDTAYNVAAVRLVEEEVVAPPVQAASFGIREVQTVTLKEEII